MNSRWRRPWPPQHIEMAATAAPGKFIFTITNDKVRLSKEEIDRMVNETKNTKVRYGIYPAYNILTFFFFFFFPADEAVAARIGAKNGLDHEYYAYNLRNSLNDEKLADKFEPADKSKLETAVNEAIKWLDAS